MSNNQNCGCGCGCNTPPPQPDGCGCGCGGNCNCGTESTVINFTTQEINQILQDGIINCSVRYTCCCGTLRPFSLSEAITLVPEKYRNVNRIITFLNHDGKPEVWIYSGRTIMDWANPTYWTSIPTSETYSEIYSKISDLELKLQDEALNRANADADLRARIDAIDGGENGEAISAVNTRITQEIEDRKTADDTLRTYFYNLLQDASRDFQNKLDAEAAERDREDHAIREEISKIDYDGIREEFDTKLEEERQYRHSEDERLEGLINGLKGDIEASTPEGFTELVEKVGTIEGEVNTLKTNVSDLSTKVDASEAKVDGVVSDVANNTSAISALDTKATANETAISGLTTKVTDNETSITNLDTRVGNNEGSITNLDTRVSELEGKPTVPELPEGSTFMSSKTVVGVEVVNAAPTTRENDNILYVVVPKQIEWITTSVPGNGEGYLVRYRTGDETAFTEVPSTQKEIRWDKEGGIEMDIRATPGNQITNISVRNDVTGSTTDISWLMYPLKPEVGGNPYWNNVNSGFIMHNNTTLIVTTEPLS